MRPKPNLMNTKLKCCPFCKSENILLGKTVNNHSQIGYYAYCADCLAQGPIIGSAFGERTKSHQINMSVEKWNQRIQ